MPTRTAEHGSALPGSGRPRVLILTASVGEGHDAPARVLARALEPDADTEIVDVFTFAGGLLKAVADDGMRVSLGAGRRNWLFDLEYLLFARIGVSRRLGQGLLYRLSARSFIDAVETRAPQVVVSTYPIASEVLGRLRLQGRLAIPVCSAVTDLAGLHYWAHPGCDVHLVAYPESVAEVEQIAGRGSARAVHGLTAASFLSPPSRLEARQTIGVANDSPVVAISGGGWGCGHLASAIEVARVIPGVVVLCLCGRNEDLRRRLEDAFGSEQRIRVLGFVDDMATLLAATDVLIHSTAGLTVLEAHMLGCRVISYGWGRGHIRLNDRAFERLGFAAVVSSPGQLRLAVEDALAAPRTSRVARFADLPAAGTLILELAATTATASQHPPGAVS